MRIRNLVILTIVFALTFVLAACGTAAPQPAEQQEAAPEPPAAVAQEPAAEAADEEADEEPAEFVAGDAVVWVAMSQSAVLDPIMQNDQPTTDLTSQIMEGLMWYGPGNVLQPLLAESYEIIDDENLVYQFNLRRGVSFHDGTPFNADAVKLSLDRLLDPENASPGAFILEMIEEVIVVDDYTVHIVLEFPFSPFTAHLTHSVGFIQSPAAIAAGTTNTHPVGTGPFMFNRRVDGDYTHIVPNPNHWRATPQHDVFFRVIPDPATRIAMLDVGEANVLRGTASDVFQFYMMNHIDWFRNPSTSLTYVGFNCAQDGPLADARIRRAITMAINAQDILYGVQEGEGILATGPVRGGLVAHAPTDVPGLPFDPDAARELLAEAGFPDGFSTSIWTNEGNAVRARISELMQANLADIGIHLDIQIMEWSAYLDDTAAGLHDMFLLGWSTMTGDSDYGIFPLFHSGEIGGANRTHYTNHEVDRLLEEARRSTNPAERDALYREVVEILVYDAPMLFLFHPDTPLATNNIDGMIFNFNDTPFFYEVTLR